MNNVSKTLYIPLYGKALVSRRGILLRDKKAEEIWAAEGFPLRGKAASKWLAYYMGMRSAVFDEWTARQLRKREDAVVLHPGCGMDSRCLRLNRPQQRWYDVDFPAVIAERRRYYTETDNYRMLAADVRDSGFLEALPGGHCVLIMEGISMYLRPEELRWLLSAVCRHFESVSLLMDCYTPLAARASRYKNPINAVGVREVFGVDAAETPAEGTGLCFLREHELTPQRYIDELQGLERRIFQKIFAGSFSRKLYRLYEYSSHPAG